MLPRPFVKRLKIHEQTQRALLQLSFVLLIALPTLLTVLFVVVAQTSWYSGWRKASWERHLSQALGFVVDRATGGDRTESFSIDRSDVATSETGDEVMRLHRVDALNSDRAGGYGFRESMCPVIICLLLANLARLVYLPATTKRWQDARSYRRPEYSRSASLCRGSSIFIAI